MSKIAVIGATGAVGRQILDDLEFYGIENELGLFASAESDGQTISVNGREVRVEAYESSKMDGFQYALMSAGGEFSKQNAKDLVARGVTVIDNSSAWRMDPEVPLVVPEVNGGALLGNDGPKIIANPNCSTIQLVMSLIPLIESFGIDSVQVSTYQSVSGAGQKGIVELNRQRRAWADEQSVSANSFDAVIFNNLIPAIDRLVEGGHCFEEEKMIRETRKITGLDQLEVCATTVRVPVSACHSEAVSVRLKRMVSLSELRGAFEKYPFLKLGDDKSYGGLPYPDQFVGSRKVGIGRLRLPLDQKTSHIVQYWNVADNLKVGAATNAVNILRALESKT